MQERKFGPEHVNLLWQVLWMFIEGDNSQEVVEILAANERLLWGMLSGCCIDGLDAEFERAPGVVVNSVWTREDVADALSTRLGREATPAEVSDFVPVLTCKLEDALLAAGKRCIDETISDWDGATLID